MGNFQGGGNRGGGFRGGNGGGRPSFGGNRGGDRREVTMHKAVCDECHKTCEVPFRPSGDKPVYCSDCFGNKREDGDRAPRRDFGDRAPKREFNDRPAAFSKPAPAPMPANDDVKKQLAEMSSKIDRLASAIERLSLPKAEVKPMAKLIPVVAKVEAKKVMASKQAVKKVEVKAPTKKVITKKVVVNKKK